jgi:hypothetical protein
VGCGNPLRSVPQERVPSVPSSPSQAVKRRGCALLRARSRSPRTSPLRPCRYELVQQLALFPAADALPQRPSHEPDAGPLTRCRVSRRRRQAGSGEPCANSDGERRRPALTMKAVLAAAGARCAPWATLTPCSPPTRGLLTPGPAKPPVEVVERCEHSHECAQTPNDGLKKQLEDDSLTPRAAPEASRRDPPAPLTTQRSHCSPVGDKPARRPR